LQKLLILLKVLLVGFASITVGFVLATVFFTTSLLETLSSKVEYAPLRDMFLDIVMMTKVMTVLLTVLTALGIIYLIVKSKEVALG